MLGFKLPTGCRYQLLVWIIYQYKGRLLFLRCCRTSTCDTE